MKSLATYRKAIVGGIVGALTAAATALADNHITSVEWIAIALALIAGTGIVYAVPNRTDGGR